MLDETKKPCVKLTGRDGNAFAIIGKCRIAAKEAKWTDEKIKEYTKKAMSGDYSHLLAITIEYFEVS